MLDDNNFHILTQTESLKLAQDKIDDRQNLLKLPSHEAQAIANRIIIDPALWKPDFSSGFEFNSLSLTDDKLEVKDKVIKETIFAESLRIEEVMIRESQSSESLDG